MTDRQQIDELRARLHDGDAHRQRARDGGSFGCAMDACGVYRRALEHALALLEGEPARVPVSATESALGLEPVARELGGPRHDHHDRQGDSA